MATKAGVRPVNFHADPEQWKELRKTAILRELTIKEAMKQAIDLWILLGENYHDLMAEYKHDLAVEENS